MAKKKKNSDFQKIKLKIGKKIPKRSNETNTQFKSKRIVLKEASSSDGNAMLMLSRNLTSNKQFKLMCLAKVLNGYLDKKAVDGEAINTLARLLIDHEEQVRQATIKCLKKCITKLQTEGQAITPFLTILLTYIKCGLTHLDSGTVNDSREILTFLVDKCDVNSHHQLMLTFLPRINVDSQVSSGDFELAEKITHLVSKHDRVTEEIESQSIKWDPKENFYDLSRLTVRKPNLKLNLSFQLNAEEDVRGSFLMTITELVEKELKDLERRKADHLEVNRHEARKLMASLKIADILRIKRDHLSDKLRSIVITDETIDTKTTKKAQTETNQLTNSLRALIKTPNKECNK